MPHVDGRTATGLLALSLLASCDLLSAPEPSTVTVEVCGSSTMGARLLPHLASRWLGNPHQFRDDRSIAKGERWCADGTHEGQPTQVCVTYESSGAALTGLSQGNCDVGMYSGPWESVQSEHPSLQGHAVGSDAIMVVAGSGAELGDEVALPTLRNWYSGAEVPEGLQVLQRKESGSGTSAAFRHLLGVEELTASASHQGVAADDFEQLVQQGGAWIYYVSAQEPLDRAGFRLLKVSESAGAASHEPSVHNVAVGTYPLVRRLHLVTRASGSEAATAFTTWAMGEGARPVFESLSMAHATSLAVEQAPFDTRCSATPETAPARLQGERVGMVYFGSGEVTEPRSAWQLAPIVRSSLDAAAKAGKDLVVVGYADGQGATAQTHCTHAQERARYVHQILESELRYLAESTEEVPSLQPAQVGGATTAWGPLPADNRAAVILAVDRVR